MPDFSDWEAMKQAQSDATGNVDSTVWAEHLRMSHTVALRMEELTNSDEWNTYRLHVAGLLEQDEQMLAALTNQALNGDEVGDNLMKLKLQIVRMQGRIEARKMDLQIPQEVVAQDRRLQGSEKGLDSR